MAKATYHCSQALSDTTTHQTPLQLLPTIMLSKVFFFLAISMAIVALSSAKRERGGRGGNQDNNDGACTNDKCKGSKVCDIENNRCVKCIQDSDCSTGKSMVAKSPYTRRGVTNRKGTVRQFFREQRTGQFCFVSKCQDTLPLKATCIKDSWCTSGMCKNGTCSEGKDGKMMEMS